MSVSTVPTYATTRASFHAVAEHVLAAVLHSATGRIGLRATPRGFGTPPFMVEGTDCQVRVDGIELVVKRGTSERRSLLETVGQAASLVGIEPGAPASVYPPATSVDPDRPLAIDPLAAVEIHSWFQKTSVALGRLARRHVDLEPSAAQLWPEHFDLAITMAGVNYGGSPGDADHLSPYAYVGPWDLNGLEGAFWNEPFGASRTSEQTASVDGMYEFFREGCVLTTPGSRPAVTNGARTGQCDDRAQPAQGAP